MNKAFTLFLFVLCFSALRSQQVLVLSDDFVSGPGSFKFNAGGPAANTGNNQWIVNDSFAGHAIYPNTPNEDSTVIPGLQITNAPYANYLHIHDITAVSSGASNDNWNASSRSDRFCYDSVGYCTLGLDSVTLVFFWLCEGDTNAGAYGQAYYRAAGVPWTAVGPKFAGQSKWDYISITDPGFNNRQNLEIGFRWVNPVTSDPTDIAFGVADIIMVGNYQDITTPSSAFSIIGLADTPVCQGQPVVVTLQFNIPTCNEEDFEFQFSDSTGSFANPYTLDEYYPYTYGSPSVVSLLLPTVDTWLGNCYRVRIIRTNPLPVIIGDTSVCFREVFCPNTIFNEKVPVIANDPDTACIESEIDAYFFSTGVFDSNNVYTAQLSDSNGSFANPTTLGTLPSSDSFPTQPPGPGDVTGVIPASVPPGCGYYIRVVSSNPYTVGPPIGPYCLTKCDELTNNITDLHFCIASGPYPTCDSIGIHDHQWTNQASYDTCNKWIIQLLNMMTFAVVNTGGLGVYYDSTGGYFKLCMPPSKVALLALGIMPGTYYMRILSTCSNEAWNETGSVIRITIGAPDTSPPVITLADTMICATTPIIASVSPFNSPPSQYQWSSNLLNQGLPFIWPYQSIEVLLGAGTPAGTYQFYVREINYGCVGPYSNAAIETVLPQPKSTIIGPPTVCPGDTLELSVTYLPQTYYNWTFPPGTDTVVVSNSEATMTFNQVGTYTIYNYSLNQCGTGEDSLKVTVISPNTLSVVAEPTPACAGQPDTLQAITNNRHPSLTTDTTSTFPAQGAMFNIIAHDSVTIDSFAVKFLSYPISGVTALIYGLKGSYIGHERDSTVWTQLADIPGIQPPLYTPMNVIQDELDIPLAPADTFGFYVTTGNLNPTVGEAVRTGIGTNAGVVYAGDGVIDYEQGTKNVYPFDTFTVAWILDVRIYYTTKAGLHYTWSTGDTTGTVIFAPKQSGYYYVRTSDPAGCKGFDSVYLAVDTSPVVNAGPDTALCAGAQYVIQGSSNSSHFYWLPATGLSSTSILTPIFSGNVGGSYILTAGYPDGCVAQDTVNIRIKQVLVNAGPDTALCEEDGFELSATSTTPNILWSPSAGLSSTTILNPFFHYSDGGPYVLTGTDSGCTVTDTLIITVEHCQTFITVADAFTPNGDGINDFVTVFGKYIAQYEIRIFNRWGQEVYFYSEHEPLGHLNDLSFGWDGTYKGKKEDIGTFAYLITAKDVNGNNLVKKGDVTLIR